MIIGITGGTGCGKTTLLDAIRQCGGLVIDCDRVYHELLATDKALVAAIDARFPGCVEAGVLDRKKLGAVVFSDSSALHDLNAITHTAVKNKVLELLENAPALAAIDAIALFESGLVHLCDTTVAVVAPTKNRVDRLMARDHIDRDYASNRITAQPDNDYFSTLCRYTLVNDGTVEDFQKKCLAFLQQLGIMKV